MNYFKMRMLIEKNHSAHWGGSFEEMTQSDKELKAIAEQYPDLYAEALADHNEMLRSF